MSEFYPLVLTTYLQFTHFRAILRIASSLSKSNNYLNNELHISIAVRRALSMSIKISRMFKLTTQDRAAMKIEIGIPAIFSLIEVIHRFSAAAHLQLRTEPKHHILLVFSVGVN